ncbi:MAG: hypothetical protein ACE5EO_12550 [Candidatus Krumholzibacteriia bacterium]
MDEVWIGMIRVAAPEDSPILDGSPGAYVNVLAVAKNRVEYLHKVTAACEDNGMTVEETLSCCPLRETLEEYDVEQYIEHIAADVAETGETMFGVFHGWEQEDNGSGS